MAAKPAPLFQPWIVDSRTYGIAEVAAVKALASGTADPEQQRRAMHFLLVHVCRVDDEPYCPASDRDTAYALGMRRVGTFIRSLLNADLENFKSQGAGPREQPS